MEPLDAVTALARMDASVGLPFALAITAVALWRRQRPLTFNRIVEVGLPAILLVMMAIRYALLAPVTAAFPQEVLGPAASYAMGVTVATSSVAAAVVGFVSWRESVAWKLCGAASFLAMTLFEAALHIAVLDPPVVPIVDTAVSVGVAAVAIVFGVFNWAHRAATPSPLGGAKGPPLDY
ncbi:hypothetical protein [Acuticoccus sp.]|uniref:hypothetical protein n=1 Tax=Acuticoccus sp. TaxID=1904378 RepID=UPI003B51CFEF